MSRDIRVLIVDDSVVVRRLLARIIEEAPGMEVAGMAANGRLALEDLDGFDPDLVTLDVEMPEMDGLATLIELRRRRPRLPVIMCSTKTIRGASTTIEALSLGASDYLTKPEGATNLGESLKQLRHDLVPRVLALSRLRVNSPSPSSLPGLKLAPTLPSVAPSPITPLVIQRSNGTTRPVAHPPAAPHRMFAASGRLLTRPAELLVIGVSTGGPNALARLIPMLPEDLPVPVLVVQHMPPLFTRMLAERLDQTCPLHVREAEAGSVLFPGDAWIARGDWHMEVARDGGRLCLREHQGQPVNSCRPAVDILFNSVARVCGGAVVALVLTGMGHDGREGARAIREAGGLILAQDEESSVVWGMPGSVANAGLADAVLPLDQLAAQVQKSLFQKSLFQKGLHFGRAGACH